MTKKRRNSEKLEKYLRKIRKIEKKLEDQLGNGEHDQDTVVTCSPPQQPVLLEDPLVPIANDTEGITLVDNALEEPDNSEFSKQILSALGDPLPEQPKYGPNINDDVARIINTILKTGLKKEVKSPLMEEVVPANCSLLIAPKMNLEIATAVGDSIRNRDKKIEYDQNQLGLGLSILCKILSSLTIKEDVDRLQIIATLCNAIRILADLHNTQTKTRKNLTLPTLNKQFLDLVKDVERDEFLFGSDLNEKIKALKACQSTGSSIKKNIPNPHKQGNYSGPSRYQQSGTRAATRNGPRKQYVKNYPHRFQKKHPETTQTKPRVQTTK